MEEKEAHRIIEFKFERNLKDHLGIFQMKEPRPRKGKWLPSIHNQLGRQWCNGINMDFDMVRPGFILRLI